MGSFFRKDVLVFWRDRKEVLVALLLPIVIIVVLNIAFSGLFKDDGELTDIHIGIVEEDDYFLGFRQFEKSVDAADLSEPEKEAILQQASVLEPSKVIIDFYNNPELKDWVHTQELSEREATELVEKGELHALVKIPEGFTHEILSSIMLGKEANVPLTIQAEDQSPELRTLQNMMGNFIDTINLQFALGTGAEADRQEPELPQGGVEVIEGVETYSFPQYFTIAISTLFALFMAQTVAMKTVTEKRERVFNRIILANSHPLQFLMGKTIATFCLALLQIFLTFILSQLLLDVFPDKPMEFWFGVIGLISAFALTVAGLSAFFTSLSLNIKDTNAVNGLFSIIIMAIAVIGGSFTPIEMLPDLLQRIGEWTPNGLTLTVLLEWIQFTNPQELIMPMIFLIGFFVACLAISIAIFPKRGTN